MPKDGLFKDPIETLDTFPSVNNKGVDNVDCVAVHRCTGVLPTLIPTSPVDANIPVCGKDVKLRAG
jgi:hypothetical protein